MAGKTPLLALCVALTFVHGQVPSGAQALPLADRCLIPNGPGMDIANIAGVPFTAKDVVSITRTLSDGTKVSHKTTNPVARDGKGRTRIDHHELVQANDDTPPKLTNYTIIDPATQLREVVYPDERLVRMYRFNPSMLAVVRRAPPPPPTEGVTRQSTDLGKQTADGLELQGTRQTCTYAADLMGNDRPFQVMSDIWYSPQLQANVVTRHEDPRTNTETTGLTEISRTEPDPGLFDIPAGYEKVEPPASDDASPCCGAGNTARAGNFVPPVKLSGDQPRYSDAAREAHISGSVSLRVTIGTDGRVENVSVVRSLNPDLDRNSIEAIRGWRFKPATKDGVPVQATIDIETSFRVYR